MLAWRLSILSNKLEKMKNRGVVSLLSLILIIVSCGVKKNTEKTVPAVGDTSQNSLDWNGMYLLDNVTNKLPDIQLTLKSDGTFQSIVAATTGEDRNSYTEGKFTWDKEGRSITLDKSLPNIDSKQFFVGENYLKALDGKAVNSVFKKMQTDKVLTEKYWKLVAINDKKVTNKDFINTEPHITFKSEFNRVKGHDGCNIFNGTFQLDGNKITFDKMLSTLMACPDSFVYEALLKTLREDLTYEVNEKTLLIHSKKMTLKFEVIYF